MLMRAANNNDPGSLAVRFRRRRFAFFRSLLATVERPIRVLDVGGTEAYWRMMELTPEDGMLVTLLNRSPQTVRLPNVTSIVGDGRAIDAEDLSYDVVFSNSVIEHAGDRRDQQRMAAEMARVARRYYVQTPNRYFPLEPHFLIPFFQFMPTELRIWLLRTFRLGWFAKTPEEDEARKIVEGIRLLGKREFESLFPGAQIIEERVLGLAKSFVAIRGWARDV